MSKRKSNSVPEENKETIAKYVRQWFVHKELPKGEYFDLTEDYKIYVGKTDYLLFENSNFNYFFKVSGTIKLLYMSGGTSPQKMERV